MSRYSRTDRPIRCYINVVCRSVQRNTNLGAIMAPYIVYMGVNSVLVAWFNFRHHQNLLAIPTASVTHIAPCKPFINSRELSRIIRNDAEGLIVR